MDMMNVTWNAAGDKVVILDQTKLPGRVEYVELATAEDVYQAIFKLKVRGAPAIGICAAFSMYVLALAMPQEEYGDFSREFSRTKEYIASSRPTAVNLRWALERMEKVVTAHPSSPIQEICKMLKEEADAIQR